MKTEIIDKQPCSITLKIDVPQETVQPEVEKAFKKAQLKANIPGFRKGRAPEQLIRKQFSSAVREHVIETIIPDAVEKAFTEKKIQPVDMPSISEIDFELDKPLVFKVMVEVIPEVKLPNYKKIKIEQEEITVTHEDIDKAINDMLQAQASLSPMLEDRAVREGDFLVVDYKGFIEGVMFENGSAENAMLSLQQESFLPGFNEQLFGAKAGEEREVKVTFPDDLKDKKLANKEAVFKVIIKEIKEKKLPKLDDEFAKDMGMATVDELKEKVAERLQKQFKLRVRHSMEEDVMEKLADVVDIEEPGSLVKKQHEELVLQMKMRLMQQGMSKEEADAQEDEIKKGADKHAGKRVKESIILSAVAEQENIQVSDEEVDKEMENLLKNAKQESEEVRKYLAKRRNSISAQLREQKIFDFIFENVKIKTVKRKK